MSCTRISSIIFNDASFKCNEHAIVFARVLHSDTCHVVEFLYVIYYYGCISFKGYF